MAKRKPVDYDIDFHLKKIKETIPKRMYQRICAYAEKELPGTVFTYNSDYTYFRYRGAWYLLLYAQTTKMAIGSKGEYSQFPIVGTVWRGSKAKDGTINFHVDSNSTWDDVVMIVDAAYKRLAGDVR